VALTSVLCKCVERAVCNLLSGMVSDKVDPFQLGQDVGWRMQALHI